MSGSSAPPGTGVGILRGDDESGIAEFYRVVLGPHFRDDELETPEGFTEGVRSGRTRALAARAEDGSIIGGLVGDWFKRSRVLLLSYVAVKPQYRATGIGSKLFAAVAGTWEAELHPLLIVGEVENPRHYHADAVMGDPDGRVRLYERLGARTLPVPYLQPALGPGRNRVPNMLLMVFGGSLAQPGAERVPGETVEEFLREYFEGCEGAVRPGDPETAALLGACQRPGGLPLLRVSEITG